MKEIKENKEGETFSYTYSAKQQEEIDKIRQKYLPREETKMDRLRKLDESAARPGTIAAATAGIVGVLLLGTGMCCTMVWGGGLFVPGIIVGVAGLLCIAAAHPLFTHITRKRREKIAPEVLELTEELLRQK